MNNESNGTPCRVAIIDYGLGNLFSVKQACERVGLQAFLSNQPLKILAADGFILPGVGAFGDAMAALQRLDLITAIKECINSQKPFMGICLGFQLLMSESREFGCHKGLNVFEGSVERFETLFDQGRELKVPHIQWNTICPDRSWNNTLLGDVAPGSFMYFIHSFYVKPSNSSLSLSLTRYGSFHFCSSVEHRNVFACQFHPEKSGPGGLSVYRKFKNKIEDFSSQYRNG